MTPILWTGLIVLGFVLLLVLVFGELSGRRRRLDRGDLSGEAIEDHGTTTVIHDDDVMVDDEPVEPRRPRGSL